MSDSTLATCILSMVVKARDPGRGRGDSTGHVALFSMGLSGYLQFHWRYPYSVYLVSYHLFRHIQMDTGDCSIWKLCILRSHPFMRLVRALAVAGLYLLLFLLVWFPRIKDTQIHHCPHESGAQERVEV